ncbi:MAG: hypothetical protein RIR26_1327 [Pseudomonadota bacterium]
MRGENPTDEELLDRYANGDAIAFETFFRRHKGRVFHYALQKVGRGELASEISQDVFLKLHSKIHLYKTNQPALPWFFTIVHNACMDTLRKRTAALALEERLKQTQRLAHTDGDFTSPLESSEERGESRAWSNPISGAFAELSREQQDVLKARVVDEKSFGALAVESGKSEVALRKIYSRAIQKIRALLSGKDDVGGENEPK